MSFMYSVNQSHSDRDQDDSGIDRRVHHRGGDPDEASVKGDGDRQNEPVPAKSSDSSGVQLAAPAAPVPLVAGSVMALA